VFLPGAQTVQVIARFPDYADPATPYMFHCHLLFHEDRGMMGQFLVVEPGQQPGHLHTSAHGHAGRPVGAPVAGGIPAHTRN
jgi:hypothetical protein